jgi:hypothetical protein
MASKPNKKSAARLSRTKKLNRTVRLLGHENPEVRETAWKQIHKTIRNTEGVVNDKLVQDLLNHQVAEKQADVWRVAAETISQAYLKLAELHRQAPQARDALTEPASLGEWFWGEFHGPSSVLRVADPTRLRRDEEAVIAIARWLPCTEFPHTDFPCVDLGGFRPTVWKLDSVGALCFVGRLYLYGAEAVRSWGMEGPVARRRFGMDFPPPGLKRGELHPVYHSIVARDGAPSGETPPHRTGDSQGERTDYGLVRRYHVVWAGRTHPVIQIAGCSTLGTLGAAHFATHELYSQRPNGKPWPLPSKIRGDSQLEALIEATAKIKGSELGWKLTNTRVLDLRIDDYIWNEAALAWRRRPHEVIVVDRSRCSDKRRWRDEPDKVRILVDDSEMTLRPASENRKLVIQLCVFAEQHGGKVSLKELGQQTWIWNDSKPREVRYVRSRLNNPLKAFGGCVEIRDDACYINAKVRIE